MQITAAPPASDTHKRLLLDMRHFIPKEQMKALISMLKGSDEMHGTIAKLHATIAAMPGTHGQDGLGDDAIVHLHYFAGGSADWYVTEKDAGDPLDLVSGEQHQAFGLCCITDPELGYVSLAELGTVRTANIDLYWTPKTVRQCRLEWLGKQS